MAAATTAVGKRETPIEVMHRNLQAAAQRLGLEPSVRTLLSRFVRETRFELPVIMDNGAQRIFAAHRVQHNDVRGPFLGGLRLHSTATVEQSRALAFAMTWNCAVANVPFGGAHGGIVCDASTLSERELEALTRQYAAAASPMAGPYKDVLTPDLGSGEKHMAWVLDEYSRIHQHAPAAVAGKPTDRGGLGGRDALLGRGIEWLLRNLAEDSALHVEGLRIAIQGFGKLGKAIAMRLAEAGCRIVAVSDSRGAIYCAEGLDPSEVAVHKQRTGSVADFLSAQNITQDALLESDCDVLIPAALECALTGRNAARVHARLIIEAADLPTTTAADVIFARKGIVVLPDILANVPRTVAANLEWSQNLEQVAWDDKRGNREFEGTLRRAWEAVAQCARQARLSLREAAYVVAVERVARVERLRIA